MRKLILKYRWSKWIDLAGSQYINVYWVLQAKRRGDGKIKFKIRKTMSWTSCYVAGSVTLQDIQKLLPN